MASNERLAQTVTSCRLCEKNQIRWKCVDCSDLFCDDCKKIHERGKATRSHKVTAVKNLNEELLAFAALNLECPEHHFVCTMYCATCNKCACANCVTDTHTGHTFQDLKALLDKKKQEIKTALNVIDDALPILQKNKESVPVYARNHKHSVETLRSEILKRGKTLKDAVDQTMNHHISELSRFSKNRLEGFSSYEVAIHQEVKDLQTTRTTLAKLMKSSNLDDVTSLLTLSHLVPNIHHLELMSDFGIATFVPGNLFPPDVQREFGSLSFRQITHEQPVTQRVVRPEETATGESRPMVSLLSDQEPVTVSTNLSSVTSISIGQNDTMWVGCAKTRKLQLLDPSGKTKDLPPVITNVLGFSLASNGDLFLTDLDNRKVRKREPVNGKLTLVHDFKPLHPCSIYVDVHEKPEMVYVGLIDSMTNLSENYENITGTVVQMTYFGETMQSFNFNSTLEQKLCTVPNRLSVNTVSGNLLVIDSTSPETGRVLGISKADSSVHFVYSRSQNHTENPFYPSDIVCTKTGKIIVCDGINALLHVLDQNGRLRQSIDTKTQGIDHPWSLAVKGRSQLCIGTFKYKGGKQTKDSQNGVVCIIDFKV